VVEWVKTESVRKKSEFCMEACDQWCLQGLVWGSVLSLIFINDLDKLVCSSVLKFADDTKLLVFSGVDISGDRDLLHRFTGSLTKLS